MSFVSYSQNLEDVILYRALKHIKKGFYIDIGAQDPIDFSVTKAFYDIGWSGINIDPMDEYYNKLKKDRPRDINLKMAVSSRNGHSSFYSFSDTGLSTMNKEYAVKNISNNFKAEEINVETIRLDDICVEHKVTEVHFLKIDVEGNEKDVINSFSFDLVRPWILVIEATEPNSTKDVSGLWNDIILSHEYIHVYFDGLNRYYVAKEHKELENFFITPPNIFDDFITAREVKLLDQKVSLQNKLNLLERVSYANKEELIKTEKALLRITSSREWKIGLFFQKIVKIAMPKNSLRRKVVDISLRFIKSPLVFCKLVINEIALVGYNFLVSFIDRKVNSSNVGEKKKVLIDCSFVYSHPEVNTGIQRVVKNIMKNINDDSGKYDVQIVPVIMFKKYLIAVNPQERKSFLSEKKRDISVILKIINRIRLYFYVFNNVITVNEGDIFLLADSVWHYDISSIVRQVRDRGGVIVAIMYDLIPVNYPQFFDNSLVTVFNKFFSEYVIHFDGFVSISKTVMDDLKKYISIVGFPDAKYHFDYFVLGSDFKTQEYSLNNIRTEISDLYKNKSVYLTVSTIEPRKNHVYLVDSFEKLWEKGIDAKLCIIGRVGWKTEELIERIKNHKEYNNRLFMFNDASDPELSFCYNKSKMLVFASFVEGFGLPIVESLNNGLPVLASDIPIHREVGEDMIEYFDLNNAEDLVNKIEFIEENGMSQKVNTKAIKTKTWKESSAELLDKVMEIHNKVIKDRENNSIKK